MDNGGYWFCMIHRAVEPRAGCANSNRIGPFDTPGEAERALQIIAAREARYEAEETAEDD